MLNSQVVSTARRPRRDKGFSLIELVIVVVIIGIIGAIAIPRISRGASGAADSALTANLAVLRNAIDLYATEHGGDYPGKADITKVPNQLMQYTDASGGTSAAKDTTHIYGPYLRSIPALPVGTNKGANTFTDTAGTVGAAWVYDTSTGDIVPNTGTEKDATGKLYTDYGK